MKKLITLTLAMGLSSLLLADATIPIDKQAMKAKLAKIAGEPSPFNKNEDFPKEYFLIPHNLPFALGLVLHHPKSSNLNLTKEQIDKLTTMEKEKKPLILKEAKAIKGLELKLLNLLESNEGNQTKVSPEMSQLVDTIAKRKAQLTKQHLQCVIDVQNILTPKQRKQISEYINMQKKAVNSSK